MKAVLVVILVALVGLMEGRCRAQVSGVPVVVDGDSLRFPGVEVRLFGIDAPEWSQSCKRGGLTYSCGREAKAYLVALIGHRPVDCEFRDKDTHYNRLVMVCRRLGDDLNAAMVDAGMALAYRHYSLAYVPQEDRARAARRGLWAGEFQRPWEFRAMKAKR